MHLERHKIRVPPVSKTLQLISPDGHEVSALDASKFHSFQDYLIDIYKEGKLVFTYRGESTENLHKKLFSTSQSFSESSLYSRLFFLGDKARHFFMDTDKVSERDWLVDINDVSERTLEFVFDRIKNALSTQKLDSRTTQSCSRRFRNFFNDPIARQHFIHTINQYNSNEKLQLRDYYIYFLHGAGTPGIRRETMLVSTSVYEQVSSNFPRSEDNQIPVTIYYFIPQPYFCFTVSPWLASEYHNIALNCDLPTYQPFGLFPEQFEVSVKGALFPHFILGVKNRKTSQFIVNPHIYDMTDMDFENAGKFGIPIDQDCFIQRILSTGYKRYVGTDLKGEFKQYELFQEDN